MIALKNKKQSKRGTDGADILIHKFGALLEHVPLFLFNRVRRIIIICYEDMEICIQEWFADHSVQGVIGIAKVYATIHKETERQLEYFNSIFTNKIHQQIE